MPTGTVFLNTKPSAQPLLLCSDFATALEPGQSLDVELDAFCGASTYKVPDKGDALHMPAWALNGEWRQGGGAGEPAADLLVACTANNGTAQSQLWQYLGKFVSSAQWSAATTAAEYRQQHPDTFAEFFAASSGPGAPGKPPSKSAVAMVQNPLYEPPAPAASGQPDVAQPQTGTLQFQVRQPAKHDERCVGPYVGAGSDLGFRHLGAAGDPSSSFLSHLAAAGKVAVERPRGKGFGAGSVKMAVVNKVGRVALPGTSSLACCYTVFSPAHVV